MALYKIIDFLKDLYSCTGFTNNFKSKAAKALHIRFGRFFPFSKFVKHWTQNQGYLSSNLSIQTFNLIPFGCGVLLLSIAAFSVPQFLTLSILALLCVAKEFCTGKNWEKQFIAVYSSF